ncbi:MAG: TonB family protein [Bacteroides sp.]|nr:TonB family protein [Bacteroides sp.]
MLLSYSIISAFIIGFGYLAYIFTMSGERQHSFNRGFLLAIYGVAILLPFVMLSYILRPGAAAVEGYIEIGTLVGGIVDDAAVNGSRLPETIAPSTDSGSMMASGVARIIFTVYIAGVALMALHTVSGWIWLLKTIRKGEKVEFDGFNLILLDDSSIAPFSWRDMVVMRRSDYREAGEMIMMHELAHLRHSHWVDLLVAQAVLCLQWFNPAAWVLREELKAVHEYQADEAVINSGADMKQYQLLLIKKAVGFRFQPLANSFNHSKLKKRVTMMYKKNASPKRRVAGMLMIPALAAGCAVCAIPSVAGVIKSLALSDVSSETSAAIAVSPSSEAIIVSDSPVMTSNPAAAVEPTAAVEPVKAEKPVEAQQPEALPAPEISETSASGSVAAAADEEKEVIYTAVETMAEFPGGMKALMSYLSENIRYPEESFKNDEQGRVIVKFVVQPDGSISDVTVVKGVSPLLDEEAVRIVSEMPKWTPGQVKGKNVASYFNLPVTFRLKSSEENTSESGAK